MTDSIVGRQPILDRNKNIYAYELLFRSLLKEQVFNGDKATAEVITNSLEFIGLNNITYGKRAFINFTEDLIKEEIPSLLPSEYISIEVLENIEVDDCLMTSIKRLKNDGFQIVLDDFVFKTKFIPLIKIADLIKIDFTLTKGQARRIIVEEIKKHYNSKILFLAEKIENYEEFQTAYNYGYDYFQGFFFNKPDTVSGKKLPSYEINYLKIIDELNINKPNFKKIEEIIKKDISMSYSLLRTINSAAYGYDVKSIGQAISLLGIKKLKKWSTLYFLKGLSNSKPDILFQNTLIRAHMAEQLGEDFNIYDREFDLFTLGLFSTIDAYLDRPIEDILPKLSLNITIKNALINRSGILGDLLNLIIIFEQADWNKLTEYKKRYSLNYSEIYDKYVNSIKLTENVLKTLLTSSPPLKK